MQPYRLLIFGASGAIGGAIAACGQARGWDVTRCSRSDPPAGSDPSVWRRYDPLRDDVAVALAGETPFDGVAFAQGANLTDTVKSFDADRHLALYRANVLSVIAGVAGLHGAGLLSAHGARLAIVSSIWQERARGDKLSYTVTKAALGGFVRSASVDLGAEGHLVNGVLPGVLDTPMTAANLSAEQVSEIKHKTTLGRLPDVETVAELVCFLCSTANTSISGQSIAVDLGMSNAQLV